ncbi:hypothetical protein [Nocardioides bigeumensis]|uniref:DUF3137 domain-containing protein n=1 Tax=Nocardioides bigeumensis TaxID=433657 RepID=A0ABP5JPP2_9ACTN
MEFGVLVVLLFGAVALLAVVAAIAGHRAAQRRRQDLAVLAGRRGWTFVERDDQWTRRFTGPPFGLGHGQQTRNIVAGQFEGRGFVAFDHTYFTTERSTNAQGHSQSREQRHDHTVVALNTGTPLPALSVAPEGFFGRLVGRVTGNDIELESEDFNRAFTVTCPSPRFASDVLHPRMMELLLTQPNLAFRFDGPSVLTVRDGTAPLPEIETRLALLDAIVDEVPEHVWRSLRGQEGPG